MLLAGKNILFIGGTRYFGRSIVNAFLEEGATIDLVSRGRHAKPADHPNLTWLTGDRMSGLGKILKSRGYDAIIDNICYRPEDAADALDALKGRCGLYVLSSSCMTYLDRIATGTPQQEKDWSVGPNSTIELRRQYSEKDITYAQGKRSSEEVVLASDGFQKLVFRLCNVVGIDDFSGKSNAISKELLLGGNAKIQGAPSDIYQLIWAEDIAKLYVVAVSRPADLSYDTYNVAGRQISIEAHVGHLASALKAGCKLDFDADAGVAPFPRNILMDTSRLHKDFGDILTPPETYLPALGKWYLENHDGG